MWQRYYIDQLWNDTFKIKINILFSTFEIL